MSDIMVYWLCMIGSMVLLPLSLYLFLRAVGTKAKRSDIYVLVVLLLFGFVPYINVGIAGTGALMALFSGAILLYRELNCNISLSVGADRVADWFNRGSDGWV